MQVKMTRIYLSEESGLLSELYEFLRDQKIKGATILRGIKGFGPSGKSHEARLIDIHVDLPMILEFFDEPLRVDAILSKFKDKIKPDHIVQWLAETN